MRRLMCLFMILSFNIFVYGLENNDAHISKFYTSKEIIESVDTRIPFEAEIELENNNFDRTDFFYFETGSSNKVKLENAEVNSINVVSRGKNFFFEKRDGGYLNGKMRLSIKGNLVVNWKKNKDVMEKIQIGYIENIKHKRAKEKVFLWIDLSNLEKLQTLDIKVKDMDLGVGVAGSLLDTKLGGEPATLLISGSENQNVKISMPQNTTIRNKNGDELKVDLYFTSPHQVKNGKKEMKIKLKSVGNGRGESGEIEIGGRTKTKENSYGKYEGSFVVRVTYDE